MTDASIHEKRYVQCARSLAAALWRYAKDRREEDKRYISSAERELCEIHRQERMDSNNDTSRNHTT